MTDVSDDVSETGSETRSENKSETESETGSETGSDILPDELDINCWSLPHDTTHSKPEDPGLTGDPFHDAKYRLWELENKIQDEHADDLEDMIEYGKAYDELRMLRNKKIYDILSDIKNEEDNSIDGTPEYIRDWDPTEAESLVHHMMFKGGSSNVTKQKLINKPIQYVLRNPDAKYGVNLFLLFNGPDAVDGARHVLLLFKDFFHSGAGDLLVQGLRGGLNSLAAQEMHDFKNTLNEMFETLKKQGGRFNLGIEYIEPENEATHRKFKHRFSYPDHDIFFSLFNGCVSIDDLDFYDPQIKELVNKATQNFITTSTGIFFRVVKINKNKDWSAHFILLSEYNKHWLRSSFSFGSASRFNANRNKNRMMSILPRLAFLKPTRYQKTQWTIRCPLTEENLMEDHLRMIKKFNGIDTDALDHLGLFISEQRDFFEEKRRNHDEASSPIRTEFYSGDSFAFLITIFNSEHPDIQRLVTNARIDEDLIFITTIRYPDLFINTEGLMRRMVFAYFSRNSGGDVSKWKDFKRAHLHDKQPRAQEEGFQPNEFQIKPKPGELPENVQDIEVEDKNGRKTYPMRLLKSLPFAASYAAVVLKRRRQDKDERTVSNTSFFVNDLEEDPRVVYEYKPVNASVDANGVWDKLQLFRINAEIRVSRWASANNIEPFFEFRQKYVTKESDLFRKYLEKHETLLRVWQEIWILEEINKPGWIRHQPEESRNNEGNSHNSRHKPKHNPRNAQPPENQDTNETIFLTDTEKGALNTEGVGIHVWSVKRGMQAIKGWLWHNVGYRAIRAQVHSFSNVCKAVDRAADHDTGRYVGILNHASSTLGPGTVEERMHNLTKIVLRNMTQRRQANNFRRATERGKANQKRASQNQRNRRDQQAQSQKRGRPGRFKAAAERDQNEKFLITQLYRHA